MGLLEILGLIQGIFKFLDQVKWLVKLLEGTPESHREEIIKRIQDEAHKFQETGRPTWD